MKKAGLIGAVGVVGACAACCAIPVVSLTTAMAVPIFGSLSISGLLLVMDPFLLGPAATVLALLVSVGGVVGAGAWYVAQRRKRSAMAQSGATCSIA